MPCVSELDVDYELPYKNNRLPIEKFREDYKRLYPELARTLTYPEIVDFFCHEYVVNWDLCSRYLRKSFTITYKS